ncbi:MAG: AAA family ATPase [Candidatus Aenigmatarchaeota archaeon]
MKKALILIIGLPGSGKTFAASVIKKHFKAKVFETGDVIREEIKRRKLPYTPENDRKMRLWFHSGREHLIVERLWKKVKNCKGITVIVGLRSPKELAMLKKLYKGKIFIIKIISSFKVRAQREIKRGRFGKQESIKYLKERDKSELSELVGLRQLLKKADYTIDNSKLSKKQMEKKVVSLIKELLKW